MATVPPLPPFTYESAIERCASPKTRDPGKVALVYAMRTEAVKHSTSEILKTRLHQSYNHGKNHRCRNTKH